MVLDASLISGTSRRVIHLPSFSLNDMVDVLTTKSMVGDLETNIRNVLRPRSKIYSTKQRRNM
jgi:hypothetical protein